MTNETVVKVVVSKDEELLLFLESVGNSDYQFIYWEAAGVYWDNNLHCFKSTPKKDWSYVEWFSHMLDLVKSIGVELNLSELAVWDNVPEQDKTEIINKYSSCV